MSVFFFFNDTATTEIYTLSLHDALPISAGWQSTKARCAIVSCPLSAAIPPGHPARMRRICAGQPGDRKSTRLNSSHANISYAVFCLKKKKTTLNYTFELISHYSKLLHSS